MPNKLKVSIVVPVYNAELYLVECIESLLNQTYSNLEIILINDGSKDKSAEICKEFEKKDNRIVYYEQKNSGVSKTRNKGIELATGELLMFVDSDDHLDLNAIEEVVKNHQSRKLICFGYNMMYKDHIDNVSNNTQKNNLKKNSIVLNQSVKGYIWNKAFETHIIKKHKILFDPNINFCEDLLFVTKYIEYCDEIKYIPNIYYNYRIRKSSVTGNFCTKKNISALKAYEIVIEEFLADELAQNELIYEYLFSYYRLKKIINSKEYQLRKDFIKKEKQILKNRSGKEKIKFNLVKIAPKIYENIRKRKAQKMYE